LNTAIPAASADTGTEVRRKHVSRTPYRAEGKAFAKSHQAHLASSQPTSRGGGELRRIPEERTLPMVVAFHWLSALAHCVGRSSAVEQNLCRSVGWPIDGSAGVILYTKAGACEPLHQVVVTIMKGLVCCSTS